MTISAQVPETLPMAATGVTDGSSAARYAPIAQEITVASTLPA